MYSSKPIVTQMALVKLSLKTKENDMNWGKGLVRGKGPGGEFQDETVRRKLIKVKEQIQ